MGSIQNQDIKNHRKKRKKKGIENRKEEKIVGAIASHELIERKNRALAF